MSSPKPGMSEARSAGSPLFHIGDRVRSISQLTNHVDELGLVTAFLDPLGDLVQRYRVLFSDGAWSSFFEFELEAIAERSMRFAGKQRPEFKLFANSLFTDGNAQIEIHHNNDHSVVIAHVWIWLEEKGRRPADHTVEVLAGNLMNLSPNIKERLDVTRPLLRAVNQTDMIGARIWVAFHVDPSPIGSLPSVVSFEADIRQSLVTKFVPWPKEVRN